jgi:hypothetical protein
MNVIRLNRDQRLNPIPELRVIYKQGQSVYHHHIIYDYPSASQYLQNNLPLNPRTLNNLDSSHPSLRLLIQRIFNHLLNLNLHLSSLSQPHYLFQILGFGMQGYHGITRTPYETGYVTPDLNGVFKEGHGSAEAFHVGFVAYDGCVGAVGMEKSLLCGALGIGG